MPALVGYSTSSSSTRADRVVSAQVRGPATGQRAHLRQSARRAGTGWTQATSWSVPTDAMRGPGSAHAGVGAAHRAANRQPAGRIGRLRQRARDQPQRGVALVVDRRGRAEQRVGVAVPRRVEHLAGRRRSRPSGPRTSPRPGRCGPATTARSWLISISDMPRSVWTRRSRSRIWRWIGHVERRGRLVGDQQVRLAGQRDRDHDPLPHAARQLVRVVRADAAPGPAHRPP